MLPLVFFADKNGNKIDEMFMKDEQKLAKS